MSNLTFQPLQLRSTFGPNWMLQPCKQKEIVFFAKQDWTGSIEPNTKCIQKFLELVHQKPTSNKHKRKRAGENGTTNGEVVDETVILAYSNGAAAWMKSCHYERALKDAYEALILEPHDLKSIHWKGCALHGMQQYELACKCFELALEQSPEKDIKLALQKSKTCDMQSKLGVYELSIVSSGWI